MARVDEEQRMNDCDRVKELIRAWEEGRSIGPDDLHLLREHCTSCSSCGKRFAVLLTFISRDVEGAPIIPLDDGPPGLSDGVMAKLRGRAPPRSVPRISWAIVAAASLVAFLGIGLIALRFSTNPSASEVVVRFELTAPEAKSVALVGSFTGWKTSELALRDPEGDGVWEISVKLKKDMIYTYNFLIDGSRWVADPGAETQVDDGFGGSSSVITL
jgi:hypothetical protein